MSFLLALLLAVALAVAAWCGLLALQRPTAPERPAHPIPALVAPPPPERLPPAPEFERRALPAAARRDAADATVVVRLAGLPATASAPHAGIATYAARTGAGFTWTPLDEAESTADGLVIRTRTRVRGDLCVALATASEWARHGYLARTTVAVGTGEAEVEVDLPITVGMVQFELPDGSDHAGPLRLARVDDPQWLPPAAATGIEAARDRPAAIVLGAGSYELVDPIDPARRQRFAVPADGPVVISPELATARAGRP